ncbi:18515_t:CDS:2 [Funneliformis geosporum]|uniref:327_t:CDS:1 n=1 Tax=Funneliformis geosporum TaxID=1117311 RepID=A0A9W4SK27_9GLOM|nr:18515_t:CDS:2 [Funneliformis geosporum]CAI2171963.1 327_t:CDS:2 [Funneliformis geosporum]
MASMTSENKKVTITDDLDDLDELFDEVLDDFSSQSTSNKLSGSSASKFPSNATPDNRGDQVDPHTQVDDEYAKQLAADMEDFVKEMEDNEELRMAMQGFMKNIGDVDDNFVNNLNGTNGTSVERSNNDGKSTTDSKGTSFQDKINQTMNKLQNSSEQLDAEITEGSNDLMEEMMKHLESVGNLPGLAENGDMEEIFKGGEVEKMFEVMMEALATKDYLYEPMKEFAQKYPKWLEENKGKVPPEDYTRYEKQSEYIHKIIEKYEAQDFDENNEQQNKVIINLMQELQDFGQPPPEIINELAPGMDLDEQGMPKLSAADLSSSCKTM